MDSNNSRKLDASERGKIDRRKLIQALGVAAGAGIAASVTPKTAAFAAQMASASVTGFKAVAYNHINYQVADYAKVRDFYISLFGMKSVWDGGKQCSLEFGDPP